MTETDGRSGATDDLLEALPARLPSVERRAVLPGGFAAGGAAAGIKASATIWKFFSAYSLPG